MHYQGIDLLLDALKNITENFALVIIGGKTEDIEKYKNKTKQLNISEKVYFLGPRPLSQLPYYLSQADILISPRIKGKNTPMKIYSYLASGVPVLATDIYSHTQVLTKENSYLVKPNPEDMAKGILELVQNKTLREKLGNAGKEVAIKNYSRESYKRKLKKVYDFLNSEND